MQHVGDPAGLGCHPGGSDQGLGAPTGNHGVHEDRSDSVPDRGPLVYLGGGGLADRLRFAGERGFLHLQRGRRKQATVRGYPVTRLDHDHIAGHELRCIHADRAAVAAHCRRGDEHLLQRLQRVLRT